MARAMLQKLPSISSRRKGSLLQSYFLIWIDEQNNTQNTECQKLLAHLKALVKEVYLCTTIGQCLNLLADVFDEKVFIISSGKIAKQIVSEIHNETCVDVIFIYCRDKTQYKSWSNQWSKIQGIFTVPQTMLDSLKEAIHEYNHNTIQMSLVPKCANDTSTSNAANLSQLPPTFVYTTLFQEIVLEMQDDNDKQSMDDFINYCDQEDIPAKELDRVQQMYHTKSPVYVYTAETFFYQMLNRALWTLDIRTMAKLGFFIRKLHRQLEQLYNEQQSDLNKNFVVYRGQKFTAEGLEQLIHAKHGLLSFNNFLSTSKREDVAMAFIQRALVKRSDIGVLFTMNIDHTNESVSRKPYAFIKGFSAIPEEEEILFSMHTVFRVDDVQPVAKHDRLWKVQLTLTDESDPQLVNRLNYIRQETHGPNGWHRMAQLMLVLGDFDQAEELYKYFFDNSTNDSERAYIYHQLGCLKNRQGAYKEAVKYYEMSIQLKRESCLTDPNTLAPTYHQLGLAYDNLGDHFKALGYYEKSHEIYEKILPSNHHLLASSYHNIGSVYSSLGQYMKALRYYEKSHQIFENVLSANHPNLATSHDNIGQVYKNHGDYLEALESYNKALSIREKSLPQNHPDFAQSYNNIAGVYFNMQKYSKSLSFYQRALSIWQQSLTLTHPNIKTVQSNINIVKGKM